MVHERVFIHPHSQKFLINTRPLPSCTVAMHMFSLFLTHRTFLRPESHLGLEKETRLQVHHSKKQAVSLSHKCPFYDYFRHHASIETD